MTVIKINDKNIMIAFKTGNTGKIVDYSTDRNRPKQSLTHVHTRTYMGVVLNNIANLKHYI